jgi:hypothetical protein
MEEWITEYNLLGQIIIYNMVNVVHKVCIRQQREQQWDN